MIGRRKIAIDLDAIPKTRKEAILLGSKHYFTSKPCANGHVCERVTKSKVCVECNRARSDAIRPKIREKAKEYARQWRLDNLERSRELAREGAKRNPLGRRAAGKRWRENNPERAKELSRKDRERHRVARALAQAKWQQANKLRRNAQQKARRDQDPEKFREHHRKWRRENPEKNAAMQTRRRAAKKNAGGSHTADDLARIREMQNGKCAVYKCKLKGFGSVDHITALSRGGSDNPANLQILCRSCNSQKHARDPIEFMQSRGFLL